jgi:hypothetical protein
LIREARRIELGLSLNDKGRFVVGWVVEAGGIQVEREARDERTIELVESLVGLEQ